MRSRLYSKNSVRSGLSAFLILASIAGCSSSTAPSFTRDSIAEGIQRICRAEHKLQVTAHLVGNTVWIYVPLANMFEENKKPDKYVERFLVGDNNAVLSAGFLQLSYLVKVASQEKEKQQNYQYSKEATENINKVWRVIYRVMLSTDRGRSPEPIFYNLIVADVQNGFAISQLFYYLDLKKVSYGYMSWEEFHHRTVQDTAINPEIIGDMEGRHLDYQDIEFDDFIVAQIEQRIKSKFEKPEVDKNADIDKEIMKVAALVLKIYDVKSIHTVDFNNLLTGNKISLDSSVFLHRTLD